jgi:hypothetical protein
MLEKSVLDFKREVDPALDVLGCEYGVDCLYLDDCLLPSLGVCSVYLALDVRSDSEKCCIDKFYKDKKFFGYNPNFAKAIYFADGKRIGNVRINSILLTPNEINTLSQRKHLGIKVDENNKVYEAIAINRAIEADEGSEINSLLN